MNDPQTKTRKIQQKQSKPRGPITFKHMQPQPKNQKIKKILISKQKV